MKETLSYMRRMLLPVCGQPEAEAVIRLLLGELCGLSYAEILLKDSQLPLHKREEIIDAVKRVAAGEPVQYVLGYEYFCGLRFTVSPSVLIPRPETAELTELIIEQNKIASPRILDVCTGSGCIAITLAKRICSAKVSGLDISADSLAVARCNAETNNVDVDFFERDVFAPFRAKDGGRYDIIVSNPPYVCKDEAVAIERNVLDFEPCIALFAPDTDPLAFYRAIAAVSYRLLFPAGRLYFEINPRFADEIVEMLHKNDFENIEVHLDFVSKKRFVSCSRPIK